MHNPLQGAYCGCTELEGPLSCFFGLMSLILMHLLCKHTCPNVLVGWLVG